MATRSTKEILDWVKLTDKYVGVVVANDGQGLITIGDFSQLNNKSVKGLCQVLQRTGGNTGVVYNPWFEVSEMAEANLQGMIYFIKNFKRVGRICTHANVDLAKVRTIYHQRHMEYSHKEPQGVPTIDTKGRTNTL